MSRVNRSARLNSPSSEDPGAALMCRVRAGDSGAFALLVERYQTVVLNTVYKYVGNRATAEELTQDIFVRVYGARKTYERKAKFDTWLYRIVFNLCVNAAEYGQRRRTLSLDQESRTDGTASAIVVSDPAAETPLQQMEREELREQVRLAIARLPGQQRAALIMSRYQGLPHQEIAESLETTVEAIKSLLFRARENLRRQLAQYFQDEIHEVQPTMSREADSELK